MNITEINISTNYRKTVDNLKRGFYNLFEGKSGDVYIVNHFPAATDGFGELVYRLDSDALEKLSK